jgi:hypothetical protein
MTIKYSKRNVLTTAQKIYIWFSNRQRSKKRSLIELRDRFEFLPLCDKVFVIMKNLKKTLFFDYIFQPLFLEFLLVSDNTHIESFSVIWKSRIKKILQKFFENLNKIFLPVISYTVRLWWKIKSVASIQNYLNCFLNNYSYY